MTPLRNELTEILDYEKALNRSDDTINNLASSIGLFVDWIRDYHGVTHVEEMTDVHLREYQKYLSKVPSRRDGRPLQASTINTRVKGVRKLLHHLIDRDLIDKKMLTHIKTVKEPKRLPVTITHEEFLRLVDAMDTSTPRGVQDRAFIECLYTTGARISEMTGLTLEHVDFSFKTQHLHGKGDKDRLVPAGKTALHWLRRYMDSVRPLWANERSKRLVFINTRGGVFGAGDFRKRLKTYMRAANISTDITPHTFRRTAATELIRADANPYLVKEFLGHSSFNSMKAYIRTNPSDLKKMHSRCHPRERDELPPE